VTSKIFPEVWKLGGGTHYIMKSDEENGPLQKTKTKKQKKNVMPFSWHEFLNKDNESCCANLCAIFPF
jgi:hypothetical protein